MMRLSTDGKVTELGRLVALASYPANFPALSVETQLPLLCTRILQCPYCPSKIQVGDVLEQKTDDN